MPMYSYECKKCKSKFEHLQISNDDRPVCPQCNSTDLEKLFSSCSVGSTRGTPRGSSGSCPRGGCCPNC